MPRLHAGRRILARMSGEWIIVILMVAAAMLSAAAFWQAAELADEAANLTNQARFADGYQAQLDSAVEAKVAHDRQILLRCQTAIERRDAALTRYSQHFDARMAAAFAEAEHTNVSLNALFLGDTGGCTAYQVARALEWTTFIQSFQVSFGDSAKLVERAALLNEAERSAVIAAVAFAIVLLVITFADAAQSARWVRRWLAFAGVAIVIGLGFAVAAFWAVGRIPFDAIVLLVGLGLFLAAVGFLLKQSGGPRWARFTSGWQATRPRAQRLGLVHPVRVWAEMSGALALVVFALAVLGYSGASSLERQSISEADAFATEARLVLETGQQSALATLNFVAQLTELDARVVGAVQGPLQETTADVSADQQARDAVVGRLWKAERQAWEELLGVHLSEAESCASADSVLAWRQISPGLAGMNPDAFPADLLASYRDDQLILRTLIDRSAGGASVCFTQAAVHWQEAQGFRRQASLYTVALVALGLAGFLFALASDSDRTHAPRQWLFAAGLAGMAAGVSVAVVALVVAPTRVGPDDLAAGARSHVEAELARGTFRCAEAVEEADAALARIRDFPPAHVGRAEAAYCDPQDAWVLSVGRDGARVAEFIGHLEAAQRLGLESSATEGNLGWAYFVKALGNGPAHPGDHELQMAREHNDRALALDPTNPYWCFNGAIIDLAADRDGALARYEEALAGLGDDTVGAVGCRGIDLQHDDLKTYMRLSALADLELLGDPVPHDPLRGLVVGSEPAAEGDCAAFDPEAKIVVSPGAVSLPLAAEGQSDPMSVIWYYRATSDVPWGVMIHPSTVTVRPGCHAGLTYAVGRILPEGHYRADVYVGGSLSHRTETDSAWWKAQELDADEFKHVHVPDLGLSFAIPRDWTPESPGPGVEIAYSGPGGRVAVQRREAVDSELLLDEALIWTNGWLERWGLDPATSSTLGTEWNAFPFVGLATSHGVRLDDGAILGVGHQQYLTAPPEALRFFDSVADDSCPGTSLTLLIAADDPAIAEAVWQSQMLIGRPHSVWTEVPETDLFAGGDFSVSIPDGWAAAACPRSLVAESPDGSSAVVIASVANAGSLARFVELVKQTHIDEHERSNTPGSTLEIIGPTQRTLGDGTPALELIATQTSADSVVQQTQLYTAAGGRVYYVAFSTSLDPQQVTEARESVLTSFAVVDVEHILPAACDDCTGAERLQRQAAVDQLASLLAVVTDQSCRDSTDPAPESATARITCSWPGGFGADFTLWATADAFLAASNDAQANPGGKVLEWRTRPDDAAATGTTVEWVESGIARFFWTYDAELVTAEATQVDGDQGRLSDWWGTTGALLRE